MRDASVEALPRGLKSLAPVLLVSERWCQKICPNIAGWNIPIFYRKYMEMHLHVGSIFQPAMLDYRSVAETGTLIPHQCA